MRGGAGNGDSSNTSKRYLIILSTLSSPNLHELGAQFYEDHVPHLAFIADTLER